MESQHHQSCTKPTILAEVEPNWTFQNAMQRSKRIQTLWTQHYETWHHLTLTAEESKQIKDEFYNGPTSSFEPYRFNFGRSQTTDSQSQNGSFKPTPKVDLIDYRPNLPRLPPARNQRTQRIVKLKPNLAFHHEQLNQQINNQREPLFSPFEVRISAQSYWTKSERQRVYRREPYVPTINDINAIINGACNISIEWINCQIHFGITVLALLPQIQSEMSKLIQCAHFRTNLSDNLEI